MKTRRYAAVLAAAILCGGAGASVAAAQQPATPRIVGSWAGALQVPGTTLRLTLKVEPGADGALRATFTSVDQGNADFGAEVALLGDTAVRFTSAAIGAAYQARFSASGDTLTGDWQQGGGSLPLVMVRGADLAALAPKRPQHPQPPFPYRAEEVAFPSTAAGVQLAGTLTLPQGAGPFPAVVLITGSGPQDRDETLLGHKPFLVLADHLTRRGVAVLRVDDRGTGKSTGSFATATSADFAEDVLGSVRFLKGRSEVDARRIGLMGHSEGGVIAPLVAARSGDVAFIVLLAGTGIRGDSLLAMQNRLIMQSEGLAAPVVDRVSGLLASQMAAVMAGGDTTAMLQRLRELSREAFEGLSEEERRAMGADPQRLEAMSRSLMTPWFRYFLSYDPRSALRQVKVPVLAVNGSLDRQVPARENLAAISAALAAGGNRDVRTVELPGLNHLFQTTTTGAPSEYGTIEETLSPALLELVSGWILERFGGRR